MKFSGKMYHENIKSHEKKCFTPSLVNTVLKKTFLGLRDAFFKEFLWIAPYKYVCFKFCKEVLLLFWKYKLNGCLFLIESKKLLYLKSYCIVSKRFRSSHFADMQAICNNVFECCIFLLVAPTLLKYMKYKYLLAWGSGNLCYVLVLGSGDSRRSPLQK